MRKASLKVHKLLNKTPKITEVNLSLAMSQGQQE